MTENNKNRFTDNETDCLIDSSFTDNLTKKIYVIDEWERIIGLCNNLWEQTQRFEKVNQRLNTENEQLKADNNRLVNETARIVAEHQRRVFDLIDEKLKEDKRYYKMTYEDELKGRIEVLEELKKELME